MKAQTEIDALGHDLENHAGQPATCTEKGWKAYVTCKREGCDYTTYREIAALGHTPSNWIVDVAATCEKDGNIYKECTVCHVELERDTTSKLGHDLEHHGKKEATCTAKGWNEYDTCKRVGCGYSTYQEIPALGHTESIDAAVAPTCTEKGKTEGKHCSVCNTIIVAQTDVAALGHDIEHHDKKDATCTELGWEAYDTCKRDGCTYTTYKAIAATGHTPSNWIVDVSATCENDGSVYKECSVCHVELERDTTSKLGHDIEHHDKKEATCTEIGWNEYDICKRVGCGYTTYQEIPALGHTGGTATCTEQAVCTRCNEKYGDVLGHNYQNDVCTRCGTKRASEGLEYSLSNDGTGYMPVRNGAFDAIENYTDFPEPQQAYQNLYAALNTMRQEYTPVSEPRFSGYYGKVNALYDALREAQKAYPARLANGENMDDLANETWTMLCSMG